MAIIKLDNWLVPPTFDGRISNGKVSFGEISPEDLGGLRNYEVVHFFIGESFDANQHLLKALEEVFLDSLYGIASVWKGEERIEKLGRGIISVSSWTMIKGSTLRRAGGLKAAYSNLFYMVGDLEQRAGLLSNIYTGVIYNPLVKDILGIDTITDRARYIEEWGDPIEEV